MTWQAWYYDILNQLFGWSRFWKLRGRGYSVKQANILITRAKLSRKKKLEILARDNYICHICHKLGYYKEMDVDHLVALANGGTNADSNLKAAISFATSERAYASPTPHFGNLHLSVIWSGFPRLQDRIFCAATPRCASLRSLTQLVCTLQPSPPTIHFIRSDGRNRACEKKKKEKSQGVRTMMSG